MIDLEAKDGLQFFICNAIDALAEGLLAENLTEAEFCVRFNLATAMIFADLDQLAGKRPN